MRSQLPKQELYPALKDIAGADIYFLSSTDELGHKMILFQLMNESLPERTDR